MVPTPTHACCVTPGPVGSGPQFPHLPSGLGRAEMRYCDVHQGPAKGKALDKGAELGLSPGLVSGGPVETGRSPPVWAETPSADRLSISQEGFSLPPNPRYPPSPNTHSFHVLSHAGALSHPAPPLCDTVKPPRLAQRHCSALPDFLPSSLGSQFSYRGRCSSRAVG